jgi:two-component system response regulator RegX3
VAHYDCLIVDDEPELSASTAEYFNMFEVNTAWVQSATAFDSFWAENSASVILLDVNLGDSSGFALCKRLRTSSDVPIIFISARSSDDDVLLALGLGGDDYVAKPYSLGVLLAKVRAVLRRSPGVSAAANATNQVQFGAFTLNLDAARLYGPAGDVHLPALEFELLAYLATNAGRPISKEELFAHVWGGAIVGEGTLNVHIRRLRAKIEADAANPVFIRTVWGKGYLFDAAGV